MKIYIFYRDYKKNKLVDVLDVDKSTCERIQRELVEGKPVIEIRPGESQVDGKKGNPEVITYYQYIVMTNVYKIMIDDLS